MKNPKLDNLRKTLLEKNITFLLGAGASAPFFSTLGNIEEILTDRRVSDLGKQLVKILFYKQSIAENELLMRFVYEEEINKKKKELEGILDNYVWFIHNMLEYLKVRNSKISPRRMNVVTTNYDMFFEVGMEKTLENNTRMFFNDGANGYIKRFFSTDNFNKTLSYSGLNDDYSNEMPSINLVKCHGSANWELYGEERKEKLKIRVTPDAGLIYGINRKVKCLLEKMDSYFAENAFAVTDIFSEARNTDDAIKSFSRNSLEELIAPINNLADMFKEEIEELSPDIEKLQIVFPTKKKFETTLITEYYFNTLRLLSYELEKEQTVLIVFGFSFYDEHITDIVQRSLNNPNLLVYIFVFKDGSKEEMVSKFNFSEHGIPQNIFFIEPNDFLYKRMTTEDWEDNEKRTEGRINYSDNLQIEKDDYIMLYSNDMSEMNGEPVIDFKSFNKLLQVGLSTHYHNKGEPSE